MALDAYSISLWDNFSTRFHNKKARQYYFHDIVEYTDYISKPFYMSTQEDIERYYKWTRMNISERHIAGSTALRKFKVLSKFADEVLAMDIYPEHAVLKNNKFLPYISFLKTYDQTMKARKISTSDIDLFLSAVAEDVFLFTIVSVIFRLGLTVPEVCALKCTDVFRESSDSWYLSIRRKKIKYMIYVPSDIRDILKRYEDKFRVPIQQPDEPYFLYKNRMALSERVLEKKVKAVADKHNLGNFSLRDMRNTAAGLMFAYGADEESVADQLGIQNKSVLRYKSFLTDREISVQASTYVNLRVCVNEDF